MTVTGLLLTTPDICRPLRLLTLSLILAMVAAAVTACSGGSSATPSGSATPSPNTTATAQPTPTATALPPQGLQHGGVLRFSVAEAPPHQDIHQSVSHALAAWGPGLAYSRVFKLQSGPDVPAGARIPECDLCESWEQTGPLEFQFIIRDDAFWQDLPPVGGRRVTAHDVVFSYHRQMTEGWANSDLLGNIAEVAAFDNDHLRIRLKAPDAELFEKLADVHARIIPREVIDLNRDLFDGPTIGSGPWVMRELTRSNASFEANRNYYETDLPYLNGIDIQYIPDGPTRVAGVWSGVLDFAESSYADVSNVLERFPDLQSAHIVEPGTGVEVAFNTEREPFASLEVRQAALLSWDVAAMREQIWPGEPGPSVGLNVPLPSWLPDFASKYGAMFGDADAAMALLEGEDVAAAGPVTVRVGEFGERYIQTAQSLAEAMTAVGFMVEVQPVTTRIFAENVWRDGDYDIFVGPPLPVASLTGQLYGIYHSEGPWNTTGYSSDDIDRLIEAQAGEMDLEKRGEIALAIQDRVMAGAHRFYAVTGASHWVWASHVRGFAPGTGDTGFLTRVWLELNP